MLATRSIRRSSAPLPAQPGPQPADQQAERGAAEHVGGVVHAEVGPGQADGARRARRAAAARPGATRPMRGRRRQRRGRVGRRERELAGSAGKRRQAAQPRAPPAHRELDRVVDPDGGGSDGGGAQPATRRRVASTAAAARPIATQTAPHSPAVPSAFTAASTSGAWQRVRIARSRRRSSRSSRSSTGAAYGLAGSGRIPLHGGDRGATHGPRLPPPAGEPLRIDGAAQPARLPRRRDLRGDGARAGRRASASTTWRSTASRRRGSRTGASGGSRSSSWS